MLLNHEIVPKVQVFFERQLHWQSHRWKFISLEFFTTVFNGGATTQEDSLSLTFDDGFASNSRVVEEILNPTGIKALFFLLQNLPGAIRPV